MQINVFIFQLEDHYVDALLSTKIDNPVFQVPRSKISVKKDFTDKEKHLKFVVTIEEPHPKTVRVLYIIQSNVHNKLYYLIELVRRDLECKSRLCQSFNIPGYMVETLGSPTSRSFIFQYNSNKQ